MTTERAHPECWLTDMDGVLVHEEQALPGAAEFIQRLGDGERRFLVLTNNSIFTPRDLRARLAAPGWTCPRSRSGPRLSPPPTSSPTSCPAAPRT